MIKVDLITGFLGAGKTTFIKKYASYLLKTGVKVAILENDFGAVNVDMMLLQELQEAGCGLEMVAGGCDQHCHVRRFRTKLISLAMEGYQHVIIEPSGIFDMDEFFDVIHESPLDRWYEIGSVITVVDAGLYEEPELSEYSRYMLASQVAEAGCLFYSRVDKYDTTAIEATTELIKSSLRDFSCNKAIDNLIMAKPWDAIIDTDYKKLENCGCIGSSYVKSFHMENYAYNSLYYMNVDITKEDLMEKVKSMLSNPSCGNIFRIKGFIQEADGNWLQLNANHHNIELTGIAQGQKVIIVIGENLDKATTDSYFPDNICP